MPRRRKITIQASELECFETLVQELQQRPEFAGFDPSSLHVWAYERYEPKLKDADAILRRFDYWLGVHKGERYLMANGSRLFNKKELAEALGVARPTLDRWITNGWLEPCRVQISSIGDTLFAAKNHITNEDGTLRPLFFALKEFDYTAVPTEANECQSPGTGGGVSSVWHRLASVGTDL